MPPSFSKETAEYTVNAMNTALDSGAPAQGDRKRKSALQVAAKMLGITAPTLRHRLEISKERFGLEPDYGKEQKPEMGVPDGFKVKGISTLYDSETGEPKIEWVKLQEDAARQEEMLREMAAEMCEKIPQVKPRPAPKGGNDDLMSVIPFGDPHFGLYCWAEEVGEDFNLDIAKRDLCAAVKHLVSQSPPSKRCLITNLGDFFHADNLDGTTAASGHNLDMDTRLGKVIRVGVSAFRQSIDTALERHETVEVVNCRANHDEVLGMAMSVFMGHIYEHEPRVIVHDQPTFRHYIRHGKVLLGVTHGHKTKDADLPGLMAAERPEEWGQTRHRYFYRGHLHHDVRREFNGCTVEMFRTLAPGDSYAVSHGWLSGRDMKLIVHHAEFGEVQRTTCSIDMLRAS